MGARVPSTAVRGSSAIWAPLYTFDPSGGGLRRGAQRRPANLAGELGRGAHVLGVLLQLVLQASEADREPARGLGAVAADRPQGVEDVSSLDLRERQARLVRRSQ